MVVVVVVVVVVVAAAAAAAAYLCTRSQITFHSCLQELDIIYKIPHCVPISAHHKWNFDDLLEKMWSYLSLIRM